MSEKQEQAFFLAEVYRLIEYWANEERASSCQQKLEGLVHSLLALIDGEGGENPGYCLCPINRPNLDLSGTLHGAFYAPLREANEERERAGLPRFETLGELLFRMPHDPPSGSTAST